ncbi:MAG: tyrosine--tRNA ligase [Gemmatimonadaceae bacterium]
MRSHALLDELSWRGLLYQHTDEVAGALGAGQLSGYIGFDPTAPSLHIGTLLVIMLLVRLQRHGHRPVALVGGGTGLIGDPSGKSSERPLANADTVLANAESIRSQLERFLDFSGPNAARMIDNAEWLVNLRAVEFMRDVGKHFTVNYMLQKDSVQGRMDAGISYTEFSYMLLQAYDFLELRRRHGVSLQMGGSDQWGNITAGMELIRRSTGLDAHAITSPLVTTSAGTKFGKTEAGTIWLDATLTSPYAFYQFLVNVDDRDVGKFLRYFTLLDQEEIVALDQNTADRPEQRDAQQALARDVTRRVHGDAGLSAVEEASQALFGGSVLGLSAAAFEMLEREIPCVRTTTPDWNQVSKLIELLIGVGMFESKKDAKRAIQQGGFYINGKRIAADQQQIEPGELSHGRYLLARKGSKSYALVVVQA